MQHSLILKTRNSSKLCIRNVLNNLKTSTFCDASFFKNKYFFTSSSNLFELDIFSNVSLYSHHFAREFAITIKFLVSNLIIQESRVEKIKNIIFHNTLQSHLTLLTPPKALFITTGALRHYMHLSY